MKIAKLTILLVIVMTIFSCKSEEIVSVEILKNRALGGDEAAIKKLIGIYGSDDIQKKNDAYRAIVEVKALAVDPLLNALGSAKGEKREYIIASLGMIKAKEAVDPIIAVLKGSDTRRYVAAFALGQINDNIGHRALIDALDDPDPEVKKYAAIALIKNPQGERGAEDAIDIADEVIRFLGRDSVRDKDFAISVIGELKDKRAVDALLKELSGDSRAKAIWALGKLKDSRAVDAVVTKLKDPDWSIRVAAARSLGNIHSEKAISALEANLKDENVFAREWAARALEDITGNDYKYMREDGEYEIPTSLYR